MNEYFLTCPRGLEEVTSKDISQHIADTPYINKGGVSFRGDKKDLYKINLYSRTGMYLLKKLLHFKAKTNNQIYKKIYEYNWGSILDENKTFSIRTKIKSSSDSNGDSISKVDIFSFIALSILYMPIRD